MFKKIKHFICKLFNIKACQCDDVDEHVEYFTKMPEPDIPIHVEPKPTHCGSHTRYIKSCHQCIAITS
jgi:uncharacterized cysteine cluster protein YcgN (CxxCxxCC family)|tara:strand:- start:151 stop:354 length:204 start_codon:yes stop_codon:yes gene_type:complete